MKALTILLVVVLFVAAIFFYRRQRADTLSSPAETARSNGDRREVSARRADDRARAPSADVRRLSKSEREELRERINAAVQRARTAATAPGTPASPTPIASDAFPVLRLEDAGPKLQQSLQEAVSHLAECYPKDPNGARPPAAALMTMFSDPEVGTVIDTDAITALDGGVVDDKLDHCLRDVIDSLALPPLDKPGKLKIQYTFRFD